MSAAYHEETILLLRQQYRKIDQIRSLAADYSHARQPDRQLSALCCVHTHPQRSAFTTIAGRYDRVNSDLSRYVHLDSSVHNVMTAVASGKTSASEQARKVISSTEACASFPDTAVAPRAP